VWNGELQRHCLSQEVTFRTKTIRQQRNTEIPFLYPAKHSQRPTEEDVRDLINRFDVNGDGELELFEWLEMAAIMFLGADDSEEMHELFKVS